MSAIDSLVPVLMALPLWDGLWNWLVEPLQYGFMVRALWVSAFVGVVCAVLSCYITLKGWSLMGDAVSHAVVPGVIIAYALGLPFALGAFVFGFGATVAIGYVKSQTRLKEDAVIGVVFTGFFAFGLVLSTKIPSNVDLFHILFGNVLGISQSDIIQTLIAGILTLAVILLRRKDLLLFCFDANHAQGHWLKRTGHVLHLAGRARPDDRDGPTNSRHYFSGSDACNPWRDGLFTERSLRSYVGNLSNNKRIVLPVRNLRQLSPRCFDRGLHGGGADVLFCVSDDICPKVWLAGRSAREFVRSINRASRCRKKIRPSYIFSQGYLRQGNPHWRRESPRSLEQFIYALIPSNKVCATCMP